MEESCLTREQEVLILFPQPPVHLRPARDSDSQALREGGEGNRSEERGMSWVQVTVKSK